MNNTNEILDYIFNRTNEDVIKELQQDKDNLIKHLENEIKELDEDLLTQDDEDIRLYILHTRDAYKDILERVRNNNYEK